MVVLCGCVVVWCAVWLCCVVVCCVVVCFVVVLLTGAVWWKAKFSRALAEEAMKKYDAAQESLKNALLLVDENSTHEATV